MSAADALASWPSARPDGDANDARHCDPVPKLAPKLVALRRTSDGWVQTSLIAERPAW